MCICAIVHDHVYEYIYVIGVDETGPRKSNLHCMTICVHVSPGQCFSVQPELQARTQLHAMQAQTGHFLMVIVVVPVVAVW